MMLTSLDRHTPLIPAKAGIQERSRILNRLEAARRNKSRRLPWVPAFAGTSGESVVDGGWNG